MATISGSLLFDSQRTAAPPTNMAGIANVPIVLQNIATDDKLAVLTDIDGNYSFINVPDGNYRVVESYHSYGISSPGNFDLAVPGSVPSGVVPPISYAPSLLVNATNLDCTTPNTLLISVSGSDIDNLYICNGPVRYVPIETGMDPGVVISPDNLINEGDGGSFGLFPPGTSANTGIPTNPYPGVGVDFIYVLPDPSKPTPDDGEFSLQNLMTDTYIANNYDWWWRIADHSTGNETGRMLVVNGDNPGAEFFRDIVTVSPDTYYLFSSWILNISKNVDFVDPALGVVILDENGDVLYNAVLGVEIPMTFDVPVWKQIGTVLYSGTNSNLTVEFISMGESANGNDYVIDDVALREVTVPVLAPVKTVSQNPIAVGDTVVFTTTFDVTSGNPVTNIFYIDNMPDGLTFEPNSVEINGVPQPTLDPNVGFSLPNLTGFQSVEVTFSAVVTHVPTSNPVINQVRMTYNHSPVEGGIPRSFDVMSNEVVIRINPAWCPISYIAFQRERSLQNEVAENSIITFDTPVVSIGDITYQPDGSIDITRRGTYIIAWFVTGMFGFATDGQLYKIRKYDYEESAWSDFVGSSNHIKNSPTAGFAVIDVSSDDIIEYGKTTIALFNSADAGIDLTFFQPKGSIMAFGADSLCIDNRIMIIENNLYDLSTRLQEIERFIYMSDITQLWTDTPELLGLGAAVIHSGYNYNFFGIGTLGSNQTLYKDEVYYLVRSSMLKSTHFPVLTYYQGNTTIGTLWIKDPVLGVYKYPIRFDNTGIYIKPHDLLTLSSGTKLSFTQLLILINPNG